MHDSSKKISTGVLEQNLSILMKSQEKLSQLIDEHQQVHKYYFGLHRQSCDKHEKLNENILAVALIFMSMLLKIMFV